jgi:hypothetical protein
MAETTYKTFMAIADLEYFEVIEFGSWHLLAEPDWCFVTVKNQGCGFS